ncbi:MAG: hypothetical protein R3B09_27050 [Nannocystaceae bacterium]
MNTPVAVVHAILADPACATVVEVLREVIARGGELLLRMGEHDHELLDPAVEGRLYSALTGDERGCARARVLSAGPYTLDVGGVRLAICRRSTADPAMIRWIAARVLSPLRTHYGLGLADFLRPDYIAAALAALAVNPTSVKLALAGDGGVDTWRDLVEVSGASPLDLRRELVAAGLDARESGIFLRLLDPSVAMGHIEDVESLERARLKLLRGALARLEPMSPVPRQIVGDEWRVLRTIARRDGAAVILSSSARQCGWRIGRSLTAVDTGSWSWQVVRPVVSDPEWRGALETWQCYATSSPRDASTLLSRRLTAALVEPLAPAPGVRVALVEWREDVGIVALRERSVIP